MTSFLSLDTLNTIRPKPPVETTGQRCFGINGLPFDVDGVVQASITFLGNGNIYCGRFSVSSKLFSPLENVQGRDFLTANGLALSRKLSGAYFLVGRHGKTPLTPQNRTSLPIPSNEVLCNCSTTKLDQAPSMFSQCPSRSPGPITLVNSVSLPGKAVDVVPIPKSAKDQLDMIAPNQKDSLLTLLLVAYSINKTKGGKVSLHIMSTSNCHINHHT